MTTPNVSLQNLLNNASEEELGFLRENAKTPELRRALGLDSKPEEEQSEAAPFGDVVLRSQKNDSEELNKLLKGQESVPVPINKDSSQALLEETRLEEQATNDIILASPSLSSSSQPLNTFVASKLALVPKVAEQVVDPFADADLQAEAFRIQNSSNAMAELKSIFGAELAKDLNLGLEELSRLGLTEEEMENLTGADLLGIASEFPALVEKGDISVVDAVDISFKIFNTLINSTDDFLLEIQLEKAASATAVNIHRADQGSIDKKLDELAIMVPFIFTKDVHDFAGTEFDRIQGLLRDLTPEDRIRVLPGLWLNALEATDGNIQRAARIYTTLTSDETISDDIAIDVMLGLVDVSIVGDVVKALKSARAAKKTGKSGTRTAEDELEIIKQLSKSEIETLDDAVLRSSDEDVIAAKAVKPGEKSKDVIGQIKAKARDIKPKSKEGTAALKIQEEALDEISASMLNASKKSAAIRKALGRTVKVDALSSVPVSRKNPLNMVSPEIATKALIQSLDDELISVSRSVSAGATGKGDTKKILETLRRGGGEYQGRQLGSYIQQVREGVKETVELLQRFAVNDAGVSVGKKKLHQFVGDGKEFTKFLEQRALFTRPILSRIELNLGRPTTAEEVKAGVKGSKPKVVDDTKGSSITVEAILDPKVFSDLPAAKRKIQWRIPVDAATGDLNLGSVEVVKGALARGTESAEAIFTELLKGRTMVHAATEGGRRSARLHKGFAKVFKQALSGVKSRKERRQLIRVLVTGAQEGKVYTPSELINKRWTRTIKTKNGNEIVESFQLTDKQIQAYYKSRAVMDAQWDFENLMARRKREFDGQKSLNLDVFRTEGGANSIKTILHAEDSHGIFVKPSSLAGIKKARASKLIDTQTGRAVPIDNTIKNGIKDGRFEVYKTTKPKGVKLFETRRPVKKSATGRVTPKKGENFEHYEFFLVRKGKTTNLGVREVIKPLPQKVLHYVPGYLPIVRRGVHRVIVKKNRIRVNGSARLQDVDEVVGFAATESSAKEMLKRIAASEKLDPEKLKIVRSQEARYMTGDTGLTGGALDSHRSGYNFYTDFITREADPITAMSTALARTSREMGFGELKQQLYKGFLNSAERFLVRKGDFDAAVDIGKKLPDGTVVTKEMAAKIEKLRDSIRGFLSLPTKAETLWTPGVARQMARALDPKSEQALLKQSRRKLSSFLLENQYASPFGAVRASNYWLFFAFTPAIGFVQAMAILYPLAMAPLRATAALVQYPMIRMAMLDKIRYGSIKKSPNLQAFLEMGNQVTSLGLRGTMSRKETRKMLEIFDESGFLDSVFNISDLPTPTRFDDGFFRKAVLTPASFPIKEGEIFARTIAFATAVREFRAPASKLNRRGLGKPLNEFTAEEVEKLLERATDLSFRFDSANKAWWQSEDVFATFTQFAQVGTKFLEDIFGATAVMTKVPGKFFKRTDMSRSKFTRVERAKLAMTSILAFGAAGIPIVPVDTIMQAFKDMGADTSDPEIRSLIEAGFTGYLQALILGDNFADIARRGAPAKQVDMFIEMLTKMAPIIGNSRHIDVQTEGGKAGIGAWVNNWLRLGESGRKIIDILGVVNEPSFWDYSDREDVLDMLSLFGEAWAEIPTATRNFKEAWRFYEMGKFVDRAGNPLITAQDEDFFLKIVAKATGWNLADLSDFARVKRLDQLISGSAGVSTFGEVNRELLRWIIQKRARGEVSLKLFQMFKDHLLSGLDVEEKQRIVNNEYRKAFETETEIQKMHRDVEQHLNLTRMDEIDTDVVDVRKRMDLLLENILNPNIERK